MLGQELLTELDVLVKKLQVKEPVQDRDAIIERVKEIRKALHGRQAVLIIAVSGILDILGTIDTNNYEISNAFYVRYVTQTVLYVPTREGTKKIETSEREKVVVYPADVELLE